MTNMSSTATTFSGFPMGNDTSIKVLPNPAVTSTGGDMAKFQSSKVGGKRHRKTHSKQQKKSSKRRNKKSNKHTHKNRRQ